jgi:NAD-dependent SIR2 family protein deacetylase
MSKVYFLGAGATKAVKENVPLNKEMVKFIFTKLNDPHVQEYLDQLESFIASFFYSNDYKNYPAIEDILSLLDYNIFSKNISIKGYDNLKFRQVKNSLVILMARALKDSLQQLDSSLTDIFCSRMNEQVTIISTNYDIVIDNALYSTLESIRYGVHIRANIYPKVHAVENGQVARYDVSQLNKGRIKLLKLHGSLNWLYCERCNELDITVGEKGIVEYLKDNSSELKCVTYPNCTCNYVPLIVTPTYLKNYDNRIFQKIWEEAEREIASAEELIFIGYSLPQADMLIKFMLINGIGKNSKRPRITVVDQLGGSEAEKNFKELFGVINYQPIGFLKYIEQMEQ